MKLLINSFLFFVLLMLGSTGFAQKTIDSTAYYVAKIEQVNTSDALQDGYRFFNKSKATAFKKKNLKRVVYDLLYLSKINFKMGFYNDSESTAVEALSILDQLDRKKNNLDLRKVLYNHLGKVYKEKNMYAEAEIKYNEALVLTEKATDSLVIYNNISNILKNRNQFEAAEALLLKAVAMFDRVDSNLQKARLLDNLGLILLKLNKKDAISYLNQAMQLRQDSKSTVSLYPSYRSFSAYYKANKDTAQALAYALKAYDVAKTVNTMSYKLDAIKLNIQLGNYALSKQFLIWNDSLEQAKQNSQNKFAMLKYNVGKSELNSQIEKTKRQQYQFIVAFLGVLGAFLFFVIRSKHKKEKLQEVYTTETRISKKVHDEVANDVYQVMTKLQGATIVKEDILDDLEQIYIKTRDISKENSAINVNQDFKELLTDLLLSYKSNQVNVITKDISKIEWQTVSDVKKTTIYRVLQELMTNMKKHSQASIVVLVFHQKNKKIEINYKDNGVGSELKKQNGLQNVENRILSINGTITFDSEINQGFKSFFII